VAGCPRDARAAVRHRGHLRLAHCADVWLYDLLSDSSPFSWWYDDTVHAGVAELRAWLSGPGAARLHAAGAYDLAIRAELLTLPYDERWAHPYWTSPTATN
jgi:hypothetical protein